MQKFDAIVIGGGHNGLTAAITLSKSGKKVALVEEHEIGGLCKSEEFGSGSKSMGTLPDTSMLRKKVITNLRLEESGLNFETQIPDVFIPQKKGEGRGLNLSYDPNKAEDEIATLSKKDAASYKEYRKFIARVRPLFNKIFDAPAPDLATMSYPGLWDVFKKAISLRALGRKDMMEVLRIGPMCVADWLGEWFESELIKTCLAGPAVYGTWCGPWSPSTNANLIISECMRNKPVKGGSPALIEALKKKANDSGVKIITQSKVKRIITTGGRVSGVRLASDEELHSSTVCSSLNPKSSILDLVECNYIDTKFELRLQQYRMRGTTSILHLEMNSPLTFDCRPDLQPEHVRICETIDSLERAFDAVKYQEFSLKPALEIFASKNPQPNGKYVCHISIHFTPYELKGGWSNAKKTELEHTVIERLKEFSEGIEAQISAKKLLTPLDIEEQFSLFGGHLHHGEHAPDQLLIRPTLESANYRTPIEGLYLCGSGTHPGGGVTCGPGYYGAKSVN